MRNNLQQMHLKLLQKELFKKQQDLIGNNQIRFKTLMLSLSLCDYGSTYVVVKGTLTGIKII